METLVTALVILLPAVLAVTVHEVAHGWMALQLGDTTAAEQGRLSLNPLRHVDPVGTVLVPLVLWFSTRELGYPVVFGWARPVPVRWQRLQPQGLGIALVAAAGPGANAVMLLGWLVLALVARQTSLNWPALIYMCQAGIMFNAAIMIINLVPIPPLDGSRIVSSLLPPAWAARYNRIGIYGLVLVALLVVSGAFERIMHPLFAALVHAMTALGI